MAPRVASDALAAVLCFLALDGHEHDLEEGEEPHPLQPSSFFNENGAATPLALAYLQRLSDASTGLGFAVCHIGSFSATWLHR